MDLLIKVWAYAIYKTKEKTGQFPTPSLKIPVLLYLLSDTVTVNVCNTEDTIVLIGV